MINVTGPGYKIPDGVDSGADSLIEVINTTSNSKTWSRGLSPFFCGPVDLYDGYTSLNVENAWQFSKAYEYYLEEDNTVGERYFTWAKSGWNDSYAHRYPMGKGTIPLYSYWAGEKLSYIEARQKIYIPLYSQAVQKTSAFAKLKKLHEEGKNLYLWDYDGYDYRALKMTFDQVINDRNKKMGHAFVIAMLLEGYLS